LPLLPFRSEHPSDEFPDPTDLTQQHLLLPLHEKILALQTEINQLISVDMKPSGKVMRYFVQKTEPPFAVIDGKKNPPKVLLRNTDESLDDPRGLVQTAGGGLFQRFITIDKPTDLQYVADVVAQVLRRLLPTNGNHTA
jgi:hypothetical protein